MCMARVSEMVQQQQGKQLGDTSGNPLAVAPKKELYQDGRSFVPARPTSSLAIPKAKL